MHDPLDPQLSTDLAPLKNVPDRQTQAAARGRMQFLQEAASLAPAIVHAAGKQNTSRNIFGFMSLFGKKPAALAARMILVIAMAAVLLGAGGTAAVYAARDSLPGETLYPLKTLGEDVRLALASSPQTELNLNLQFAERRMTEISALLDEDEELAAQSILRLQNHLQNAMQASQLVSGEQSMPALQRLRDALQYQQRLMQQLQLNTDPAKNPFTEQSGELLQQELDIIEDRVQEEQLLLQQQKQMQEQVQQGPQGGQEQPAGQPDKGQESRLDSGQLQQTSLPENPVITPTPIPLPQGGEMQPGNGSYQAGKEASPMPEEKQQGSGK